MNGSTGVAGALLQDGHLSSKFFFVVTVVLVHMTT